MNRLTSFRLDELLAGARAAHVLVVGDLMLDVYLRGSASRISPEAPVPVVRVDEEWRAVGGAANVAANAAALGAGVDIVGATGADRAGADLREELERLGIEPRGLWTTAERPTTVKTRILVHHHQVARYDRESEAELGPDAVRELLGRIESLAAQADVIVLEDYNKGVLSQAVIRGTMAIAERLSVPIVVDPKFRNFFEYAGATVFKPNQNELAAVLRDHVRGEDPEWLERTRVSLGCRNLLLTLGDAGMVLQSEDGEHLRVPAVARDVYDVSGAGDTVIATLAVAMAAGATLQEAAVMANHAAAIEVGKAGVATVAPDELREAVRLYHERQAAAAGGD